MIKSKSVYRVRVFDPTQFLATLKEHEIEIYDFQCVDEYLYQFSISSYQEKKFLSLYKEVQLVRKTGMYSVFEHLFKRKTALVGIIFALLLFFSFTSRIYEIEVEGNSRILNARIQLKLEEMGIKKYVKKPNYETLLQYENELKNFFYEDIESLELRSQGVQIKVRYEKRRKSVELPTKTGPKYARKKGIISHFVISSGVIKVKENQYVEEGTLLVDDTLITPKGEEIKVGAEGQVYAWTWTIITVSKNRTKNEEEVETFSSLLNEAEQMVKAGFIEEERIDKEVILSYEINEENALLKVHFTCLEDIAK